MSSMMRRASAMMMVSAVGLCVSVTSAQVASPPVPPAQPAAPGRAPTLPPVDPANAKNLQPVPDADKPNTAPFGHVETRGSGGTTLVLIAGLGCDWSVWDDFMTRNAEKYTMHAVTLPGFGGSPSPAVKPGSSFADLAWLDNAEWALLQLIDEKKIEKAVVIGQGLGGQIALRFAAHHPERVSGVMSLHGHPVYPFRGATMPTNTKEQRAAFITAQGAPRFETMNDEFFNQMVEQYSSGLVADSSKSQKLLPMLRKVDRRVWTRYYFEYLAEDVSGDMSRITAPIVMVAGMEPSPTEELAAEQRRNWEGLMAGAPKTRWVFLDETRDLIQMERPAEVDREVAALVEQIKGAGN